MNLKDKLVEIFEQADPDSKWDSLHDSEKWKRVRPTWANAVAFGKSLGSKLVRKVDPEQRDLREQSCFGQNLAGEKIGTPCINLKVLPTGKFCGACGCGANKLANLEDGKLDFPYLECPLRKPGFSNSFTPPMSPKISVCMAAQNESLHLESTIQLLVDSEPRPDEIIVVDDRSEEPIADRLKYWVDKFGVKVIRNEMPAGAGAAKHQAVEAATGDLIVVLDAHMRFPWNWTTALIGDYRDDPNAVFCFRNTGFEYNSEFCGLGARFRWTGGWLSPFWETKKPDEWRVVEVPAIYGGAYAVPRHILEAVGGYAPLLRGWGCEEEFLSLRAWACGFRVKCVQTLEFAHQYKRKIRRVRGSDNIELCRFSRCVVAYTLFPDLWKDWEPMMFRELRDSEAKRLRRLLVENKKDLDDLKDRINVARKLTMEELVLRTGIDFPPFLKAQVGDQAE